MTAEYGPAMSAEYARERALDHCQRAERLLADVSSRQDEGPMFGAVKTDQAQAHATLALFWQGEAQAAS